jgi:predicted transcriptional regulator of viral defense system
MKYGSLVELVGSMECFDLPLLVQAFAEPREIIRVQLSRWMSNGKIISLRRGVYTLPDIYRRVSIVPARLANQLYRPSYLSGLWALGYYDMIPEKVVWLTSATPRVPRRFDNSFGVFDYRNIKQKAFFGYGTVPYGDRSILTAEPEKALLDHWHLTPGEWTQERLEEMRYQHCQQVNKDKLQAYADRFQNPRLNRAVERWLTVTAEEEKGTVTL